MCQSWISFKFFSCRKIKDLIFTTQINWRECDYSNIMTMVKEKAGLCNWLHCESPGSKTNPVQSSSDLGKFSRNDSCEFLPESHCFKSQFLRWPTKIWNLIRSSNLWSSVELFWDSDGGGRTCWDSKCWAADFAHHDTKLTPVLHHPVLVQNSPCGILRAAELSGQVCEWAASHHTRDGVGTWDPVLPVGENQWVVEGGLRRGKAMMLKCTEYPSILNYAWKRIRSSPQCVLLRLADVLKICVRAVSN